MSSFVLDASVSLAWFVDNPVPALSQRIRSAILKGSSAVVPALWQLEMANGFVVAERRGIQPDDVDLALQQLGELRLHAIEVSSEIVSLNEAFALARKLRLSAYDAAYLETARRLHLPLATLDRSLAAASKSQKVPLFR